MERTRYLVYVFRTTQDVIELRRWAEAHGAQPCREDRTGRLVLAIAEREGDCRVGWDEFEATFLTRGDVFVYDEGTSQPRCFVGPVEEARAFICGGAEGVPLQ